MYQQSNGNILPSTNIPWYYYTLTHNGGRFIEDRSIMVYSGDTEVSDNVEENNPADINGSTPVFLAAKEGHYKICKLIIKNMTNCTKNGSTAPSTLRPSPIREVKCDACYSEI